MYEYAVEKWHAGILIDIETREKVVKKYGEPGMSRNSAMTRALEDAVKGVRLTKKELDAVRAEIKANYDKRMAKREARKRNGGKNPGK